MNDTPGEKREEVSLPKCLLLFSGPCSVIYNRVFVPPAALVGSSKRQQEELGRTSTRKKLAARNFWQWLRMIAVPDYVDIILAHLRTVPWPRVHHGASERRAPCMHASTMEILSTSRWSHVSPS